MILEFGIHVEGGEWWEWRWRGRGIGRVREEMTENPNVLIIINYHYLLRMNEQTLERHTATLSAQLFTPDPDLFPYIQCVFVFQIIVSREMGQVERMGTYDTRWTIITNIYNLQLVLPPLRSLNLYF